MREERLDIVAPSSMDRFDAICFTSNGVVVRNRLVMGAGVAKVFRDRFDDCDLAAGLCVRKNGNICQIVQHAERPGVLTINPEPIAIIAFPTKNHWRNPSDLKLIEKSAVELMGLVNNHDWSEVALPRPGCLNGGLDWADVKQVIEPILDNRIVIVTH